MLKVSNLVVRYGDLQALHGVDLVVPDGGFVAVLGRNGAGKTTLVSTIAGLLKPAGGRIDVDGDRIDGAAPVSIVRRGIAVVPEGRQLFGALSVRDNLSLGSFGLAAKGLRGLVRSLLPRLGEVEDRLAQVVELLPELTELLDRHAGNLSGGQQQMVSVGRALMADPRLLLVDELSLGLAPLVVERLLDHLAELNRRGIAIALVEQNIALALRAATHAYVLEGGSVRFHGSSAELAADQDVLSRYLGLEEAVSG
ncbi:MAG: ABC transporter ATP-binding protein [Micromonosporaceae bacterium]